MSRSQGGSVQLSPWDQIPYFQTIKETDWVINLANQQIALADPGRIAIIFSYIGANSIEISTVKVEPRILGFLISPQYPTHALYHNDCGYLVQNAWYMSPGNVGDRVHVIEVLMKKWPGEE